MLFPLLPLGYKLGTWTLRSHPARQFAFRQSCLPRRCYTILLMLSPIAITGGRLPPCFFDQTVRMVVGGCVAAFSILSISS